jgi:hypothetical protein
MDIVLICIPNFEKFLKHPPVAENEEVEVTHPDGHTEKFEGKKGGGCGTNDHGNSGGI